MPGALAAATAQRTHLHARHNQRALQVVSVLMTEAARPSSDDRAKITKTRTFSTQFLLWFVLPPPYAGPCTRSQTTVATPCGSGARRPPSAERTCVVRLVASCLSCLGRSCGSLGRLGRRGGLISLGDGRLSLRSPASSFLAPPLRESFCHSLRAYAEVGR